MTADLYLDILFWFTMAMGVIFPIGLVVATRYDKRHPYVPRETREQPQPKKTSASA